MVHTPLMQEVLGNTQTVPQLPQLFTSVDVLTHVPPQFVWPAGQRVVEVVVVVVVVTVWQVVKPSA
jgi:hypothetical protein